MKTLLALLLLALPQAIAQDTASLHIRLLCFERAPEGTDRLAILTPENEAIPLKFPESFPSLRTTVPLTGRTLRFLDPSAPTATPLATAAIPSGIKDALVIFFPVPAAEEGQPVYKTVVIDSSARGIPEDGALVMNIFPEDVRIVLGEHRVLLKSGKSAGLARPAVRNDYNMAPVVFQSPHGAEWKTAAETLVRFPPGQRQFFVSYPDIRTGRLAFRAYRIDDL